MRLSSCACFAALLWVSPASAETPPEACPKLEGRWRLVSLLQNGHAAPAAQLKDAHVEITDELMVFHLPSKPDYPDLHIKYEFVPEGIDLRITDSGEQDYDGPLHYGTWSLQGRRFRFAFFDKDGVSVRPPVGPAKSVVYVELRRE